MANLTNPVYYSKGSQVSGNGIGYEKVSGGGVTRVIRYQFTTPSERKAGIWFTIPAGNIVRKSSGSATGYDLTTIPFYITDSSSDTSYKNAIENAGYPSDGEISGSSGRYYSGGAIYDLEPDTTYYVWFYPPDYNYRWSTWDSSGNSFILYHYLGLSAVEYGSSVSVTNQNGNRLRDGSALQDGDTLNLSFSTDEDYKLTFIKIAHSASDAGTVVYNNSSGCDTYNYTHTVNGHNVRVVTDTRYDPPSVNEYTLSITEQYSSVTVNRRSSPKGNGRTGVIYSSDTLYEDDELTFSFQPNSGYKMKTATVNGSSWTSSSARLTVKSNVTVRSIAEPENEESNISASEAAIGGVSEISIENVANNTNKHSIKYTFGGLSGWITSSGGTSNTEVLIENRTRTISFALPNAFEAEMGGSSDKYCNLLLTTYTSSGSKVGTDTCIFNVVSTDKNKPTVTGKVWDINNDTISLTGNQDVLIPGYSTAKCEITATPKAGTTISSKSICGTTPDNNGFLIIQNVPNQSFVFSATDSLGRTGTDTVRPTFVNYVPPTCSPFVSWLNTTSEEVQVSLIGNVFRGSFGAQSNVYALKYRYKTKTDVNYGEWIYVDAADIQADGNSYQCNFRVSLAKYVLTEDTVFDGGKTYYIYENDQYSAVVVNAGDSVTSNTYYEHQNANNKEFTFNFSISDKLHGGVYGSEVESSCEVHSAVPIFDWGSDGFNVNVPFNVNSSISQNGHALIRQKRVEFTNVEFSQRQGDTVYTREKSGYYLTDLGFQDGDFIIGAIVTYFEGTPKGVFVPCLKNPAGAFNTKYLRFVASSDGSNTPTFSMTKITVLITYCNAVAMDSGLVKITLASEST